MRYVPSNATVHLRAEKLTDEGHFIDVVSCQNWPEKTDAEQTAEIILQWKS
jgi:hypothetical protein